MSRDPELVLETERLLLSLPARVAAPRVLRYFSENRAHHQPWDPPRPEAFFTLSYWERQLERNRGEFLADQSLRLFLFARDDVAGPVLGTCNFTGFARGPFQACRLGYALAAEAEGKGLMTEALRAALGYVFEELGLHRVEANYLPSNQRSERLLKRLGFVMEGYARDYLFIDGAWRDHQLSSRTRPRLTMELAARGAEGEDQLGTGDRGGDGN